VKGPDVLEKLARIRSVFLDKTGTLTFGTPQVVYWDVPEALSAPILAIEAYSAHSVAKALVKFLRPRVPQVLPEVEELKETMGLGIRARVEGDWIELRRAQDATQGTEISVFKNETYVGRAVLADRVRPESKAAVALLRSLSLEPRMISGDHSVAVEQVARSVGIDPELCISEVSPERKREVLQCHPHALMVGDGANDAIALAQADVGIAVHSGVEISLRAADVYLSTPGVQPVYELLIIARETLRVVQRNFCFSVVYNIIAGGFALAGKIDPLLAAVLMPISALTVLLSSIVGTLKMRRAFQGLGV
jgi:P-type E1-E2 ATPase